MSPRLAGGMRHSAGRVRADRIWRTARQVGSAPEYGRVCRAALRNGRSGHQAVCALPENSGCAGLLLLLSLIAALGLANSPWSTEFLAFWETQAGLEFGRFEFRRSSQHWINDGLMTFFFFVVALELKRELMLGELRNPHMAALPLAGALGGMVVPVAVYLVLMWGQPGDHGWGVVMATDTAFVIGSCTFDARIPPSLRLYLLSLAIFDDVGAILVCGGRLRRSARLGCPRARALRTRPGGWLCPCRDQRHSGVCLSRGPSGHRP